MTELPISDTICNKCNTWLDTPSKEQGRCVPCHEEKDTIRNSITIIWEDGSTTDFKNHKTFEEWVYRLIKHRLEVKFNER